MYNDNRYNDKIITVTVTDVRQNRDIHEILCGDTVIATTKFDSHINEIKIGSVNKLHIRQDYRRDQSYYLKTV